MAISGSVGGAVLPGFDHRSTRRPDLSAELDDASHAQSRADLERALGEMGIDLNHGLGRDNAYVKAALARWASAGHDEAARELAQPINDGVDLGRQVPILPIDPVSKAGRAGELGRDAAGKIDTSPITNEDTGWSLKVSKTKLDQIANKFEKSVDHRDHVAALRAVREITARAVLVDSHADTEGRPEIRQVHRFFSAVDIGGRRYAVKTTVRELADGSRELDDGTVHLLHEQRLEKKLPAAPGADGVGAGASSAEVPSNEGMAPESEPDSAAPSRHTEATVSLRDLLAGIKDTDGDAYAQAGTDKRGSIRLPAGGYGTGPHVITLFAAKNRSTLFHETAHLWLEELVHHASDPDAPEVFRRDLKAVLDWMGVDHAGEIGDAEHEKFARAFEAYLMEGKAPSVALEGVFAKVRAWLTHVYARIKGGLAGEAGFPVELTPEVRGVMDRLLATEEQTEIARRRQGLTRLFATAEEAKMTPAEFDAYTQAVERARAEAVTDLERRAIAEQRRESESWWREEEDKAREEASSQVDARPDIQALHYFRTGEMLDGTDTQGAPRVRLDEGALVKEFGPGILKELSNAVPKITAKEGGVHPDLAAELFGMRSGRDLVKALVSLTRQEEQLRMNGDKRGIRRYLTETMARERMLERHGDMLRDGSIVDKAMDAVHTDRQMDVLAAEIRALAREPKGRNHQGRRWAVGAVTPLEVVRDVARRTIAGMRVGELNLNTFARAEAKAGREAEKAILAGKREEALKAKQQQILNHALFMEARKAKAEVDSARDLMGKFAAKPTMAGIDQPYLDRIHDLLRRIGVAIRRDGDELSRGLDGASLRDFVAAKAADLRDVAIPDFVLDESFGKPVHTLTVDEIKGVRDAIVSLAHNGRAERKITLAGQSLDLKAAEMEAADQVAKWKLREPHREWHPDDITGIQGALTRLGSLARKADASLLKMEQQFDFLDNGDPDGVFNRGLRRLKGAEHREKDLSAELSRHMASVEAAMPKGWRQDLDRRISTPELLDPRTGQAALWPKKRLLAVALNIGNKSNLEKLLGGYRWDEAAMRAVLDRELTKADWDYIQGIWDAFRHLRPEIDALQRRTTGLGLEMVEDTPVRTRFGEYRGGYYPVVYDAARDYGAEKARQQALSTLAENNYQRATPPRGHTISRTDVANKPISLDLDLSAWKLGQAIHDLAFREAVIDADKFLNSKAIRDLVDRALGPEYSSQFRPWLQSIANARNIDDRGLQGWDRFAAGARANAMIVGIGFRMSTMLKHGLTALSNSFGELGPYWLGVGGREFFGSPQHMGRARDFVYSKSGEMRNRMDSIDRDVRESLARLSGDEQGVARLRADAVRFGHYGVAMLDMASAMPTWLGAYRKALAEGATDADAVWRADKAVRNAHGAQGITDLAAIQRGTETQKLFTMFYGFFNHIYNRERATMRLAGGAVDKLRDGDRAGARHDFAMVLARSWFYLVAPALIEALVTEPAPDQDKGESWAEWTAKAILGEIPAGIPVVRDLAKAALSGRGYEMSPVAHEADSFVRLIQDVHHTLSDGAPPRHWLKHAVETSGYAFGLPTGQASGTLQYLWDVMDGDAQPAGGLDFLRGVIFGPKPKGK